MKHPSGRPERDGSVRPPFLCLRRQRKIRQRPGSRVPYAKDRMGRIESGGKGKPGFLPLIAFLAGNPGAPDLFSSGCIKGKGDLPWITGYLP
nr:hypothetical protein [Bacillaceae bacterium]